jgi:hypothetical protein
MERINPVALSVLQQYVPLPNLGEGMDVGMGMSMGGAFNNYLDTRAQKLPERSGNGSDRPRLAERQPVVRPIHTEQ